MGLVTICGARAKEPNEGERDREKIKKEKGDKNEWIKTKNKKFNNCFTRAPKRRHFSALKLCCIGMSSHLMV